MIKPKIIQPAIIPPTSHGLTPVGGVGDGTGGAGGGTGFGGGIGAGAGDGLTINVPDRPSTFTE